MQRSNRESLHFVCTGRQALRKLALLGLLLGICSGCASTTQPPLTEAARVAQAMRAQGAEVANLRPVAVRGGRAASVAENQAFDIPGISLDGQPVGTIRIYKDERHARADQQIFAMLGQPGPQTKLDYVTVAGKRELILNHRLPNEVAQRYIAAFTSSP